MTVGCQSNHVAPKGFVVLDHFMDSASTVQAIRQEFQTNGILDRLRPARTAADTQISGLLRSFLLEDEDDDESNNNNNNNDSPGQHDSASRQIRGDCNIFFQRNHHKRLPPGHALKTLVDCVETTVRSHLGPYLELEESVSVQLAVYPGDGLSGYPRHCDRTSCATPSRPTLDSTDATTTTTTATARLPRKEQQERILTALYYLTPTDWSLVHDGGCLRLFSADDDGDKTDDFLDVCPYPNRLVVFRSDRIEHQVLPSKRRDRMALTIWFYGTERQRNVATTRLTETDLKRNNGLSLFFPTGQDTLTDTTAPTSSILPPPLPVPDPYLSPPHSTARILVSIAAFRDSETGPTIRSLFSTAQFPNRISVGLVLQVDPEQDKESIIDGIPSHNDRGNSRSDDDNNNDNDTKSDDQWNIRTLSMHARDAQGPCYARYLGQTLWRGEDYVLQIDSHTRFRQCWDSYLIATLPKGKTLLTTYPVGYRLPNRIPHETRGTLLVPDRFDSHNMLRQRARVLTGPSPQEVRQEPPANENPPLIEAIPCTLYAAGFNFGRARVLQDCPYPNLPHIFFGEELYMAASLYKAGYTLYAPTQSVVYHLWSRAHRPVPAPEVDDVMRQESTRRVMGLLNEMDQDFWTKVGVADWTTQQLVEGHDLGGLSPDRFADADHDSTVVAADIQDTRELVNKVAALDDKAQDVIAAFLGQLG